MQNRNAYEHNDHKNRTKITNGIEHKRLSNGMLRTHGFAICFDAV